MFFYFLNFFVIFFFPLLIFPKRYTLKGRKDDNDSKFSTEDEPQQIIKKAKIEDDEYKNTTEEHTYYR